MEWKKGLERTERMEGKDEWRWKDGRKKER